MIKLLKTCKCYFSKPRSRQNFVSDPKLKDLTKSQMFQDQIQKHRFQHSVQIPQKTLTQTLKDKYPKINDRFKVDRQSLQKKVKKAIQKQLNVDKIVPGADDQNFQTLQSKSYIHNQRAEIQFQQKFQKQLFKKKQTNRIISKQKNDFRNYLQQPKNHEFLEYELNVKKFKNNKIDSMMNFKRNNQQLRLLIDSGYIDNPNNLEIILDKMNNTPRLQNNSQKVNDFQQQNAQMTTNKQKNTLHQIKLLQNRQQNKQISPQIQKIHLQMVQNLQGPTQLRNPHKLQQFFSKLEQSTQVQKQKAKQDLQLIKKIKSYEENTFQNRYNALNFRFKGQVNFDWMNQTELLSYIKKQKNIDTQPLGLLTMYIQNRQKKNKFNQPIITPTVMARIYSVCSLYRFPQSDENNKMNMLNDKKYIQLQKNLFKNVHQLSDESFADAVYAYSKNHKEQQGLLKMKMNSKISEIIFSELNERVGVLHQEDLGIVLRSIPQTNVLRNEDFDWTNIIQNLGQRLSRMEQQYQFQSTITFLTLVPPNELSISAVQTNMSRFKEFKWQAKQTLESFLEATSFLIRFQDHIPSYKKQKVIQQLKYIVCKKTEEIMPITQQISINNMPQLLSIIYYLDKLRPTDIKYQMEISSKLINKCKKQIVDNIRQQKQLVKKYTVGGLTMSMALNDYCKALIKKHDARQSDLPVLQISTLKSLFSFRPLPFNSINYFTYHEMIKLVNAQIVHLPIKFIVQTIFSTSLVRYKNQGIMEQVLGKLVQKIYFQIKQQKISQSYGHSRNTKQYAMIVCSFHHSRMITEYYYHFVEKLTQISPSYLVKLQPNLLLRFFQSIVSLSFTTDKKYSQDYAITSHFAQVFNLCYDKTLRPCIQLLSKEESLVLEFVAQAFQFFTIKENNNLEKIQKIQQNKYSQIKTHIEKFKPQFNIEDKCLSNITILIRQMQNFILIKNQNQNLTNLIIPEQFSNTQAQFFNKSINEIMDQEQQIGSQFKYQTVYQRVQQKLSKQNKNQKFNNQAWRIQNSNTKQVYFLATYEHLLAKYQQKNTNVRLFGIWKFYSEFYMLKKWNFKLICSFLEG